MTFRRRATSHDSYSVIKVFRFKNSAKDTRLSHVHQGEARLQYQNNRQNSIAVDDAALQQQWSERQRRMWDECMDEYRWALDNGIAKEVARAILPEGMTWSRLYVNGTFRSWIHYLQVRTDPTMQKEHRELAQAYANEIARVFPSIGHIIDPNTDISRED